jgi:hypothetical protein
MTGSGDAPLRDNYGLRARGAVEREARLPATARVRASACGPQFGRPAANSTVDEPIPSPSRGKPAIDTFLKAPYGADVRARAEHAVTGYAPGASLSPPVPPKGPVWIIGGRASRHD